MEKNKYEHALDYLIEYMDKNNGKPTFYNGATSILKGLVDLFKNERVRYCTMYYPMFTYVEVCAHSLLELDEKTEGFASKNGAYIKIFLTDEEVKKFKGRRIR